MSKINGTTTRKRQTRKGPAGGERRSGKDRRRGTDRRKVDIPVAVDRRKGKKDRRSPIDRRQCPLA